MEELAGTQAVEAPALRYWKKTDFHTLAEEETLPVQAGYDEYVMVE